MSGNTLPLDKRPTSSRDSHECIPGGGNGKYYSDKARTEGDFDQGGYCARSIGCVEIGSRAELEDKFIDLMPLEDTPYYSEVIQGDVENVYGMTSGIVYTGGKYVAMPTPYMMDVGLAAAEWPLASRQFADATITLELPLERRRRRLGEENKLELLSEEFADGASFGKSENQKFMSKAIEQFLKDNISKLGSGGTMMMQESQKFAEGGGRQESEIFAFSGVDLFDAKMVRKKKKSRDSIDNSSLSRYLRASRWTQEEEELLEVTYTFTARGSYNVSW
jgi:hypothetical protein